MPVVLLGAGALAGWLVARGTSETASLVKWTVIGGGVYLAGKVAKAW